MVSFNPLEVGSKTGEVGVAAYEDGGMIGAATAVFDSSARTSNVQALFVQPAHRGRGVALGLIQALERRIVSHGATRMEMVYRASDPTSAATTHILAKTGWRIPSARMLTVAARVPPADLPWMRVRKPGGYEIFGWSDLGEREVARIAPPPGTEQRSSEASRWSSDCPIETHCSVAVRYRGEVVGWMLTHRLDHERVRYSRLFVERDHQARFSGVALIAEAFRRQRAAGIPKCLCAIASDNEPMVRLVGRLAPYIESKTEICCASKNLG